MLSRLNFISPAFLLKSLDGPHYLTDALATAF